MPVPPRDAGHAGREIKTRGPQASPRPAPPGPTAKTSAALLRSQRARVEQLMQRAAERAAAEQLEHLGPTLGELEEQVADAVPHLALVLALRGLAEADVADGESGRAARRLLSRVAFAYGEADAARKL